MKWTDRIDRLCEEYSDYLVIKENAAKSAADIASELLNYDVDLSKARERGKIVANLKRRRRSERVQKALKDWAEASWKAKNKGSV